MSIWAWRDLGEFAKLTKGLSYKSEDYGNAQNGAVFITLKCFSKGGGFNESGIKFYKGAIAPEFLLRDGDLLIANTDLTRDGDVVGSPLLVPNIGNRTDIVMSMDISRIDFSTNDVDKNYLYYVLNLPYARKFMQENASGSTVLHLKTKNVPRFSVWLPENKNVQTIIANILITLDRAIAQTEALIAKHQRIKTGLMQDLLTRGIDEHGQLRHPSTHKFKSTPLGMIPVEWEVGHFGQVADCIDPQPDHRAPAEVQNGEPYIGVGDFLDDGTIDFVNCRKVSKQAIDKQAKSFSIETGDIIFGKIGTIGLPRKLIGGRYGLSANTVLIKPKRIRDFVFWLVNSKNVDNQVKSQVHSTSQPAFGIQKVRALIVPIPTEPEQEKITQKLNAEEVHIKEHKTSLEKLKSIKRGLMQDLLSGKVSVTGLLAG